MLWNANGLLKHKSELEVIINLEKIDICLISETHCTKRSKIQIQGFEIYQSLHPSNTPRGGSAIIISKHLKHHLCQSIEIDEFQATTVNVELKTKSLLITALYSPPRSNIKCENYSKLFQTFGKKAFLIGGDFNAKNTYWGSRLTNTKGRELYKAIKLQKCEAISTGKPTYWPSDTAKLPDLIDFFIFKKLSRNYMEITDSLDLSSDHSPILLTLHEQIIQKETNPLLCNIHTDWNLFKTELENKQLNFEEPLNAEQLDNQVLNITTIIQEAAWKSTPKITNKQQNNKYPKHIVNLIREKRKLNRRWHITRSPILKKMLNKTTKKVTKRKQSYDNIKFQSNLSQLGNDKLSDYSLWKYSKKFQNNVTHVPPIRDRENKWAKSDKEKATLFADHLASIFNEVQSSEVHSDNESDATNLQSIPETSLSEIHHVIMCELKKKKSPSFDLLTAEILQHLPLTIMFKLTQIINSSFKIGYVPSLWKVSEIMMIPKPGKPTSDIKSYRPISILPILSKVYEKILLRRMNAIVVTQNILPNHQFGFRSQHSTIDQVHRICDVIEKALEERKVCSALFLDISQAFDKVWHAGLLEKIGQYFPKSFTTLISSYLNNRYYRVKCGLTYSNLRPITCGVPQGSILGPLLYLIYTHDLPTHPNCVTGTFADDTAILAVGKTVEESTRVLQSAVNDVKQWTDRWHIKLNQTKSTHVNFTNKDIVYTPIYIDGQQTQYSNTAKYLGMTLDCKLRWKEHIKMKVNELNLKYRKLHCLIGKTSRMSIYNKLLLYKQLLQPIWAYGIQLWGCAADSNIKVVQQFQNKVIRHAINAPWYVRDSDLHRDLGIKTVDTIIKEAAKKHKDRLITHVNQEASILTQINSIRRLKRKKPIDLCN